MKTRNPFKSITFVGIVVGTSLIQLEAPQRSGAALLELTEVSAQQVRAASPRADDGLPWIDTMQDWLEWLLPKLRCPKAPPPDDVETGMRQATECYQANGAPVPESHLHRIELIVGLSTIELLVEAAPAEIDPVVVNEFLEAIRKMKNELEAGQ